jgi:hypothetical protein
MFDLVYVFKLECKREKDINVILNDAILRAECGVNLRDVCIVVC